MLTKGEFRAFVASSRAEAPPTGAGGGKAGPGAGGGKAGSGAGGGKAGPGARNKRSAAGDLRAAQPPAAVITPDGAALLAAYKALASVMVAR